MKKIILASLFLSLLLLSCESSTENDLNKKIDERLVGVWYNTASTNLEDGPRLAYNGIEITEDGTVYELGINLQNGNLDYLRTESNTKKMTREIVSAYSNKVKYEYHSHQESLPAKTSFDEEYALTNNVLFIFGQTYYKTKINVKLTAPKTSEFNIDLTNDYLTNHKLNTNLIVNYPNVFAYNKSNSLSVKSVLNNNYFLDIRIKHFSGIGIYNENNIDIDFSVLYDDVISVFDTNDYNFKINLDIKNYDELKSIIGTLNFTMEPKNNNENLHTIKFENGTFNIPLY